MSERFTTNEAAAQLGVTPARVRQMIANGEIESEKFGRDRVIMSEALAEAMKRKTKPGPAARSAVAKGVAEKSAAKKKLTARWENEGGAVLPAPKKGGKK